MLKRITCILMTALMCFMLLPTIGAAAADTQTVTVRYAETDVKTTSSFTYDADMSLFDADSDHYEHRLAQLSLCMALSAFRKNGSDLDETDLHIHSFLDELGFEGYRAYGYHQEPSRYTISNAIAYRRMTAADGSSYVLLAVPVCGQGYGNEWLSNFQINVEKHHAGFSSSAQQVYKRVLSYIETNLPGERVKVWATGFSRAAAVSNMLGDLLLNDSHFQQNDIFVYTFGTPNNTTQPVAWPQIYNICNGMDPVPRIPFADWGYGKHGTTFYLPTPESTENYAELAAKAEEAIASLTGLKDKYASSPERNWLIGKVLDLLYTLVPDVSLYTDTLQTAVQTAWTTQGPAINKLAALIEVAQANGASEREHWQSINDELSALISSGLSDTLHKVSASGGSEMWMELLSSGVNLAGEHFPRVYLGWMMSGLDETQLYGQKDYIQIVFSGDANITLVRTKDDKDDSPDTLLDTVEGISKVPFFKVRNTYYLRIPSDAAYYMKLVARKDTTVQFANSVNSLRLVHNNVSLSEPIELKKGEELELGVVLNDSRTLQNGILYKDQLIDFSKYTDPEKIAALFAEISEEADNDSLLFLLGQIVIAVYLLTCLFVLLYALVVGIKRLVRGRIHDPAAHRKAGAIMMYITIAISLCFAALYIYGLTIRVEQFSSARIVSQLLKRISSILGIGTYLYFICGALLYLLLALECWKSINHQLPRIRIVRLSILMIVQKVLALFASNDLKINTVAANLELFVPILALVSLSRLRVRGEDERIGKKWIPVMRAIVMTTILFFLREVLLWLKLITPGSFVCNLFNALICIPSVLLALYSRRRVNDLLRRATLAALLLYMIADTVIDIYFLPGIILFSFGHLILLIALLKERKPSRLQFLFTFVLAAGFSAELILARDLFPLPLLISAIVYDLLICTITVTAFPIGPRLRSGTLLFLLSNELLLFTYLYAQSITLDAMSVSLFCAALLTLATSEKALLVKKEK